MSQHYGQHMVDKKNIYTLLSITILINNILTEHQFYHKWAILNTLERDIKPGPKGYIKIDVGILSKGEVPHFPLTTDEEDEIEGYFISFKLNNYLLVTSGQLLLTMLVRLEAHRWLHQFRSETIDELILKLLNVTSDGILKS